MNFIHTKQPLFPKRKLYRKKMYNSSIFLENQLVHPFHPNLCLHQMVPVMVPVMVLSLIQSIPHVLPLP